MKNVVIYDDFKEYEVRPPQLLKEYVGLLESEVGQFFPAKDNIVLKECPACGCREENRSFVRFKMFVYHECRECLTVYVSPRPSQQNLERFYAESRAAKFWEENMLAKTEEARAEHLFAKRAQWIEDICLGRQNKKLALLDVTPALRSKREQFKQLGVLTKFADRDIGDFCKGYEGETFEAVTAFDVIGSLSSPLSLITSAHKALGPGGMLFLSMTASTGFDIQVLWDRAARIFPPDHLNLFSPEGIEKCLNRQGFELIELSTPGQLDVDIVRNVIENEPDLKISPFLKYLLQKREEESRQELQEFLQRFKLSSYMRVVAQKRKDNESAI